ncbi:hypothetical protein M409DRAFT_26160 [Zasmidium cellare ATCC 36951]|uniref:Uncharacterized protein n=1 Tax=Zasmidium cellare ATCC 36951 TaxID=1080233 RepID=A0A6A6C8P0_ZASCE|nr:uncharacterized protein M409DRAFT_26160 [Zasmidium cellare ATCC 36951]KAF2163547.1 hypothetical protein M409DRAFT_26160 [Zasmidium cellare ATCC 36951]
MSVYEGVWYNHAAQELVLTLRPAVAGFLEAALVTFVHLVAAATWPIWRFILYSIRQNSTQDVFHAQRQVAIRNSNTAANAAGQMLKMMFGWRKYKVHSFARNFIYLVVCVAVFILWTICGLYAPYIYTRTSPDVLLAGSELCGWPSTPGGATGESLEMFTLNEAAMVDGMRAADAYVQQCYGKNGSDVATKCNAYPHRSLNFTTSDGECPFGNNGEVCVSVNSTVMRVDTGYLDSSRDFGVNLGHENTIQYRKVSTCSPIHTAGFVNIINTTGTPLAADYLPGAVLLQYMYGPQFDYNFTYEYNYQQLFYPIGYTVAVADYIPGNSTVHDGWVANSTLYNQTDGDVSLVFMAGNQIKYPAPVYDPFYAAGLDPADAVQIPYQDTNVTYYTTTRAVSVIACKEQHQFCLAGSTENCSPLGGIGNILDKVDKLPGANMPQIATAGRIGYALATTSIAAVLTDLGPSALLVSRTLNGLQQLASLPIDQWRAEVSNWHSIAFARMQAIVLSYAAGPEKAAFNQYVQKPGPALQKWACKTQRVRDSHGYINFDMAGLIVLVVVGAGLVVLGFVFESLVGLVSKLGRRLGDRRHKWLAEGLYHLHKETLQARGVREWQDTDQVMPKSHWSMEPAAAMDDPNQAVSFLHVPMKVSTP